MIKLDIQDYCHTCPNFEPEKVVISSLAEIFTFVQCEHKGRCINIAAHIKKELSEKESK